MTRPKTRWWLPLVGLAAALEIAGAWAASLVHVTYTVTGSQPCGDNCWQWSLVGVDGHPFLVVGVLLMVGGAAVALLAYLVRRRGFRPRAKVAESA